MHLPAPPDPEEFHARLAAIGLARDFEVREDGAARLTTPFVYPDGTPIELLQKAVDDMFLSARLTDGGRTFGYLGSQQVQMEGHEKREHLLHELCQGLGVEHKNGELAISLYPETDLADAVLRLAQACIRTADLHYTLTFKNKTDFHQIFFADFLSTERPDHIENFSIDGRFGRNVKIDFFVRNRRAKDHLIITMTSTNKTSSHAVANDVFCRWYDLERYKDNYAFLTVLDSTSRAFHEGDINRVADVSRVIRYPDDAKTLRGLLGKE